ncbi:hypothetical protein HK102_003909, partial [Quaeritorhiza haematococci]
LRMYFFFGVLWAIFFFNLVVYVYIGHVVMKSRRIFNTNGNNSHVTFGNNSAVRSQNGAGNAPNTRTSADRTMQRYFRKTAFYMAAFFINWSFGTINRIQNLMAPTSPVFVLFLLHAYAFSCETPSGPAGATESWNRRTFVSTRLAGSTPSSAGTFQVPSKQRTMRFIDGPPRTGRTPREASAGNVPDGCRSKGGPSPC